ncbi:hypothetical protein [Negadavirga shengliensis]|uniref:Uncharacterized protein n=1 Tax=Negadavirga shengliensis TaxID=1389218 RepID=A0ABV9T1I5_9BACT
MKVLLHKCGSGFSFIVESKRQVHTSADGWLLEIRRQCRPSGQWNAHTQLAGKPFLASVNEVWSQSILGKPFSDSLVPVLKGEEF